MANVIEIVITSKDKTDLKRIGDNMDDAGKKGGRFASILQGVGQAAGQAAAGLAGLAVGKVVSTFTDSIGLATDLNEALNKSNVVFGDAAAEMERFASTAAQSIGLAKGEALDAAGTFGNLFDQLGFANDETLNMSTSMMQLAADFGSFHNADITDVIEAQTAAFRGEYDSLQRFVPTINAAAVEQQALAETGKKSAKELTNAEKAAATYTFMMENAGAAMGDFAATSGEGANAQRIAAAEMENAKAQLGEKLLPLQAKFTQLQLKMAQVLTDKVVPAVGEMMEWFSKNEDTFRQIGDTIMAVLIPAFQAIGEVISFLNQNREVLAAIAIGIMAALVPAFIAWAASAAAAAAATLIAAAPLILIGALVAALAFVVIKYWDEIKAFTIAAFSVIWQWIKNPFEWIRDNWGQIVEFLMAPTRAAIGMFKEQFELASSIVVGAFNFIKDVIMTVFNWIKDNWKLILGILTGPVGIAVALIVTHWETIKQKAQFVFAFIQAVVTKVFNSIKQDVTDRINAVVAVFNRLRNTATAIFNGIRNTVTGVFNGIKNTIFGAVDAVVRKIKQIGNAVSNIPGAGAIKSATSYIPSFATGGIGSGGLALVGERGPELANLAPGGRVQSAANTQITARQNGLGGGGLIVVNLNVAGTVVSDNDIVGIVRDEFRRGGFAGVIPVA